MLIELHNHPFSWIERLLRLDQSERRVAQVKENVSLKVDEVTHTLTKAGSLQTKVMKKTTTFYIAKAIGGL